MHIENFSIVSLGSKVFMKVKKVKAKIHHLPPKKRLKTTAFLPK
jgi:hypothetical protein